MKRAMQVVVVLALALIVYEVTRPFPSLVVLFVSIGALLVAGGLLLDGTDLLAPDDEEEDRRRRGAAGWQKPVSPPPPDSRPGGLPPRER